MFRTLRQAKDWMHARAFRPLATNTRVYQHDPKTFDIVDAAPVCWQCHEGQEARIVRHDHDGYRETFEVIVLERVL